LSTLTGNENSFKAYGNILVWLCRCFDKDAIIHHNSLTESDRVFLIRTSTEFLAVSAGIKLNPRKLYASNCATAKELLKVTSALLNSSENVEHDEEKVLNFEDTINNEEIRKIRSLSSELTGHGVNIYDLISKESLGKSSQANLSKPLELNTVEKGLEQTIANMKSQINLAKTSIENQKSEKANLESKIQRKESELERSNHRLATLSRIRPAYLEEYEKIEVQMKELYCQYTLRVRCYDAVKNLLSNGSSTPTSYSPVQKVHDSSIPVLPEEEISDEEEAEDENSDTDFNDDQSLLNQDIFKQVSNRLASRNEKKSNTDISEKIARKQENVSLIESSESDDLESGELEFSK
jgi:clusterin-associated protein 1